MIKLEISEDLYMTWEEGSNLIKLMKEKEGNKNQLWRYNTENKTIVAII